MKLGLALTALVAVASAEPLSAATYTVSYQGTISGGYDVGNYFGTPTPNLAGYAYTASFVYDPSVAPIIQYGPFIFVATDSRIENSPDPILSASVSVNGVTVALANLAEGTHELTVPPGNFPFGSVATYADDGNGRGFNFALRGLDTTHLPFSLTKPFSASGQAASTVELYSGFTRPPTFFASFSTGTVSVVRNSVPEPETWLMIITGFVSIGICLRSRSSRTGGMTKRRL